MWMIGPALGSHILIGDHVINALEQSNNTLTKRIAKAQEAARTEISRYVDKINREATEAARRQQEALPESAGKEAVTRQEGAGTEPSKDETA